MPSPILNKTNMLSHNLFEHPILHYGSPTASEPFRNKSCMASRVTRTRAIHIPWYLTFNQICRTTGVAGSTSPRRYLG